ncbi:unnamed protein product [Prorocentrum cordatum]|uniref:Uncharacterized protein n=1 Tax=Prorocentrum cordatum TaxID=2364126 RepID=A0ABN9S2J9_9DINO|nr:unnamed protein product [Polarella glacialis]
MDLPPRRGCPNRTAAPRRAPCARAERRAAQHLLRALGEVVQRRDEASSRLGQALRRARAVTVAPPRMPLVELVSHLLLPIRRLLAIGPIACRSGAPDAPSLWPRREGWLPWTRMPRRRLVVARARWHPRRGQKRSWRQLRGPLWPRRKFASVELTDQVEVASGCGLLLEWLLSLSR